MANVDYRGLAGSIEKASAGLVDDPGADASDRKRVRFTEISGEEGGIGRHNDRRIVAEAESGVRQHHNVAQAGGSNAPPLLSKQSVVG